ncbi:EpsG family protein [Salinivibrio sp. IB872]|uniref:EpsG family protein n=1 Tax=Salinivibrio sp. IB872 TaxID=1766123 RepID=UPI0009875FE3|nr:hypothetical protein BZJ18_08055 [Salinivibrio sp. IB872]
MGYADSKYAESVKLFDITNIKNTVLLLLFVLFSKQLRERVEYFDTMMLFYFLSVTWRIAFNDFGIFAARIATFFGIVEVILVPTLLLVCRQKLVTVLGIILYAFLTLYMNLYVKEGRFPYELAIF